jgi:hypothetical protein
MAGPFARNDQPRTPFAYHSDSGIDYYILMEAKYATPSGLTAITGTPTVPLYPYNHKKLRHIYIRAQEDSPNAGRLHSRRVPCKSFTPADLPTGIGDIDGLTGWTFGALHGETVPL